jgi:hypothetical protein
MTIKRIAPDTPYASDDDVTPRGQTQIQMAILATLQRIEVALAQPTPASITTAAKKKIETRAT